MGIFQQIFVIAGAIFGIKLILEKATSLRRVYAGLKDCPGGTLFFINPFNVLAVALAPYYPFKGWDGDWYGGFNQYAKYGSTCISSVLLSLGSKGATPILWIADAETIHEITANRTEYDRSGIESYELVNFFGENILSVPRAHWKRHRATANPAFNEANNALVWKESLRVVHGWFDFIEAGRTYGSSREVLLDANRVFSQMSFSIFSAASLGIRTPWNSNDNTTDVQDDNLDSDLEDLKKRKFNKALASVAEIIMWKALPDWLFRLLLRHVYIPGISPLIRKSQESFDYLTACALDMIYKAREQIIMNDNGPEAKGGALLRNLVEANMSSESEGSREDRKQLSDRELLSNMIIFFVAGHETTAHTLSFTAVMLALYPHIQEKVLEEVLALWPDDNYVDSVKDDSDERYTTYLSKLVYTNAVILETLRLFPILLRVGKKATVDTTIRARRFSTNADGDIRKQEVQSFCIPVKKGSVVILDIGAVHMNPIHWGDDVKEFRPERFIDNESYRWPRKAFQAFSSGSQGCIGQRFAMTELVCIIANLVRRYEILIPEELRDKSREEQKRILLEWKPVPTATPANARLTMRLRRKSE